MRALLLAEARIAAGRLLPILLTILTSVALPQDARASAPGGMRLFARGGHEVFVSVKDLDEALTRHGASTEAVRTQVELALRQCGLAPASASRTGLLVIVSGLSSERMGYSAAISVHALLFDRVRGEDVTISSWTEGTIITGPPGTAAMQIRTALAELLDVFCNLYLEAKSELPSRSRIPRR